MNTYTSKLQLGIHLIIEFKENFKKIAATLFVCIAFCIKGFNQSEAIIIDSLTGAPSKHLPFDSSFTIKFSPTKGTVIAAVDLFELTKRGCLKTPFKCPFNPFAFKRYKEYFNKEAVSYRIPAELVKPDSVGNLFIRIPQLAPNRRFFIIISKARNLTGMDTVLDLLRADRLMQAREVYTRISNNASTVVNPVLGGVPCKACSPEDFKIILFDTLVSRYRIDFLHLQLEIEQKASILNNVTRQNTLHNPNLQVDSLNDTLLHQIIKLSQDCLSCKDSLWEYQWITTNKNVASFLLTNLRLLNDTLISHGYSQVDSFYFFNRGEQVKTSKRLANLTGNLSQIVALQQLVEYFRLKSQVNSLYIIALQRYLNNAFVLYKANLVALNAINKAESDLKDAKTALKIFTSTYFGFIQPSNNISSSTFTFDFDTRAGFVLKADFGFLAYGNPWNNPRFKGFSPYLGFHVNFRPLNTGIPYSHILRKGLLGHLSFNSGLLLTSISDENKKRDGLFGNLSMFTGLGWAFGHAVRLTGGAVWFRKINPNPLITSTSTAATPYLGLSLDLRLRDAYSSFTKLFQP